MLGSKFVKCLISILKRQVNSSSNFASFFILMMTHNFSVNYKLRHFLFWIKGSHQSPNFNTFWCSGENFRNSSCHFPNPKPVFLQLLHHFSVSWKLTPLYFFRSNAIYFAQKEPIKIKLLGQTSLNSFRFWNNKSVFLQILHQSSVSWDITPLYFFSWNFIYFQKRSLSK